jgi:hypothetical protein
VFLVSDYQLGENDERRYWKSIFALSSVFVLFQESCRLVLLLMGLLELEGNTAKAHSALSQPHMQFLALDGE